jgi:hypothetical protein
MTGWGSRRREEWSCGTGASPVRAARARARYPCHLRALGEEPPAAPPPELRHGHPPAQSHQLRRRATVREVTFLPSPVSRWGRGLGSVSRIGTRATYSLSPVLRGEGRGEGVFSCPLSPLRERVRVRGEAQESRCEHSLFDSHVSPSPQPSPARGEGAEAVPHPDPLAGSRRIRLLLSGVRASGTKAFVTHGPG